MNDGAPINVGNLQGEVHLLRHVIAELLKHSHPDLLEMAFAKAMQSYGPTAHAEGLKRAYAVLSHLSQPD